MLAGVLEEAWDKLELFEERKRTNLIFCGVRGEARETQAELINKVGLLCKIRSLLFPYRQITSIIRSSLNMKKSVTVASAARLMSGPKVGSCR